MYTWGGLERKPALAFWLAVDWYLLGSSNDIPTWKATENCYAQKPGLLLIFGRLPQFFHLFLQPTFPLVVKPFSLHFHQFSSNFQHFSFFLLRFRRFSCMPLVFPSFPLVDISSVFTICFKHFYDMFSSIFSCNIFLGFHCMFLTCYMPPSIFTRFLHVVLFSTSFPLVVTSIS